MMKPKTEEKSLAWCPLPGELAGSEYDYGIVPREQLLPTIVSIDGDIESLSKALKFLQDQRGIMLKRAVDEDMKICGKIVLLENLGNEIRNPLDLEKFKAAYPKSYARIRKLQKSELKRKYDTALEDIETSTITLGLADDDLGADEVTKFVGVKPRKITYEVREV